MIYNKYVTLEKIQQFDEGINQDKELLQLIKQHPILREVCRAGLFLAEELEKDNCPEEFVLKIQEMAGKLSYKKDPWSVSAELLERYRKNELIIENYTPNVLN